MPASVSIERHKLNHAMYQKLKKYIMNKRKREQRERAQDAYINKLKREREERNKQFTVERESLEQIRKDAANVKKKISQMKHRRDQLYDRIKQIAHEESAIRTKSKDDLLSSMQNQHFGLQTVAQSNLQQKPVFISPSQAPNSHVQNQQSSITPSNLLAALSTALGPSNINPESMALLSNLGIFDSSVMNSQSKAQSFQGSVNDQIQALHAQFNSNQIRSNNVKPHTTQHDLLNARQFQNTPITSQATSSMQPANNNYNLAKYLIMNPSQAPSRPQSQSDRVAVDLANYEAAFLKLQQQQQSATVTQKLNVPKCSSSSIISGTQTHSVSNSSSLLPPASVSYRGSITTGQSAQQIQYQQHAAATKQNNNSGKPSNGVKSMIYSASANLGSNAVASGGSILTGQSSKHPAQQQITNLMKQQAVMNQLAAVVSGAAPQSPFLSATSTPSSSTNQNVTGMHADSAAIAMQILTGSAALLPSNIAATIQKQMSAVINSGNNQVRNPMTSASTIVPTASTINTNRTQQNLPRFY